MAKILDFPKYFWSKVTPTGFCWLWEGSTCGSGYGQVNYQYTIHKAHRWSYEQLVGEIPDGFELDHLCRIRNCVNPDHLEPVPKSVNVLRGYGLGAKWARRTHCHNCGGDDWVARSDGGRRCRPCTREAKSARQRARRTITK